MNAPLSPEDIERRLVERRYAVSADRRAAIEAELDAAGVRITDVEQGVRWERV